MPKGIAALAAASAAHVMVLGMFAMPAVQLIHEEVQQVHPAPQASEATGGSFVTAGSDAMDEGDSGGSALAPAEPRAEALSGSDPQAPDLALDGEDQPLLARGAARHPGLMSKRRLGLGYQVRVGVSLSRHGLWSSLLPERTP